MVLALAITALSAYLILSAADRFRTMLGETGIHILSRIMGMLLMALAAQFRPTGYRRWASRSRRTVSGTATGADGGGTNAGTGGSTVAGVAVLGGDER